MKKVLVLAALAALVATSAFAANGTIVGSKHDLKGYSVAQTTELCVYCHTPHGGSAVAPLWNRTISADAFTMYTSATLNATPVLATGDTQLCMGCHDGNMSDTLLNTPSGGNPAFGTITSTFSTTANLNDGANSMKNDHPVGFTYNAALVTADTTNGDAGLNDPTIAAVDALLFGATAGSKAMWCSSCHDVHSPGAVATFDAPFLRISNQGSNLCLTCHNK